MLASESTALDQVNVDPEKTYLQSKKIKKLNSSIMT